MGAMFCHFAALRLAIEFLVRAHWETAVLGQILAGRPREVTGGHGRSREVTGGHGSKFLPLAAPWPQIEFLFWDHWERAVLGQSVAGRSREVIGGYGRLRAATERENGEQWRKSGKKVGDT